jgi:formylglycine-generating enzyme required for sulfatase activity
MIRGGSFNDNRVHAALSIRNHFSPPGSAWNHVGFRVGLFSAP